ncbi:hypothetical protein Tco_0613813 [Tanacetum coccineum]
MSNVKKSVMNKRQMQTQESKIDTGTTIDAHLVATKSSRIESEVQDDSSKSGNDTNANDVDIRPIYDEEPMTETSSWDSWDKSLCPGCPTFMTFRGFGITGIIGQTKDIYSGIMEMEPDIENMTFNEYFEYEAAKKRQLWDNVRSRKSPPNYDETDFDSFY